MFNKKAQIWGIDAIIGTTIFLIAITLLFLYSINSPNESQEILQDLSYDGKIITNTLLSDGTPENWNESTVFKIGILTDHQINQTKLEMFYNITQNNYQKTKILFNTKYNYAFFLDQNITINSNNIEYIGKPGINKNEIDTENLIHITRFTSYKNTPTTAHLYIWGNY